METSFTHSFLLLESGLNEVKNPPYNHYQKESYIYRKYFIKMFHHKLDISFKNDFTIVSNEKLNNLTTQLFFLNKIVWTEIIIFIFLIKFHP